MEPGTRTPDPIYELVSGFDQGQEMAKRGRMRLAQDAFLDTRTRGAAVEFEAAVNDYFGADGGEGLGSVMTGDPVGQDAHVEP